MDGWMDGMGWMDWIDCFMKFPFRLECIYSSEGGDVK